MSLLRRRKGRVYGGVVCRAAVPRVTGATGYFAVKKNRRGEDVPNFKRPLHWTGETFVEA